MATPVESQIENESYKDLSREISTNTKNKKESVEFNEALYISSKLKLEVQANSQILELRREWSTILKRVLIAILAFEVLITFLVGLDLLNYKDYEWLINTIVIGGFAQILTMPLTVAKFLFSNQSYDNANNERSNQKW